MGSSMPRRERQPAIDLAEIYDWRQDLRALPQAMDRMGEKEPVLAGTMSAIRARWCSRFGSYPETASLLSNVAGKLTMHLAHLALLYRGGLERNLALPPSIVLFGEEDRDRLIHLTAIPLEEETKDELHGFVSGREPYLHQAIGITNDGLDRCTDMLPWGGDGRDICSITREAMGLSARIPHMLIRCCDRWFAADLARCLAI